MRVVVVGGGYAGIAAAARLAKLGHEVTLLEAGERLGGALSSVEQEGFRWDAGSGSTLLPAVLRDLFRKTGRPLEAELDLVPVPTVQHRFDDDSVVDLPFGSTSAQTEALDAGLGAGTGARWAAYVDAFAEDWEALRGDFFEHPWDPQASSAHTRRLLGSRLTLHKAVRGAFKDDRLRALATWPSRYEGHDPRQVPAWYGVWSHVERSFGVWTVPGGMARVGEALAARLVTRGVTVAVGTEVRDLAVEGGRVRGVLTDDGPVDADAVVCAVDPRRLPALEPSVRRTMPAIPPVVCHVGLVGEVPDVPREVVIHDETTLVVRTDGQAPPGAHAWTILARGRTPEDLVSAVHRNGLRIRDLVEVRVDRSPKDMVLDWHGSPMGTLWQGRQSLTDRLGARGPFEGVYVAGAHGLPGPGLPAVGLSAAHVAELVGAAPRP